MNDQEARVRPCPRCGEPVCWNDSARWKPFCSERCRLIDLGAWLAEEHSIPGDELPGDDASSSDPRDD